MSASEQLAAQDPIRAIEPPAPEPADQDDLDKPSLYSNRELSWMDFNDRVLGLVEDPSIPLIERVKFAAIWSTNLDEFIMIRVGASTIRSTAGSPTAAPTA